ncbi:hypothetical protein [Stutzerimonas stutzeri]|uniref:hypothetical protein n=1 Tax=Stutzerimonas stutzeri TaxID=316 RepID=UPI00265D2EC8|nr:hypothetical protein [Stutzerimonas stutzeri]MCF6783715.1 hypothetical protein [Stutzerimonas stutzeri]
MRNGTILQIKGMGIPVQSASDRNMEGYEVRWSSDPQVHPDSPAHVLIGHEEVKRFLELAVDRRFIEANLLTVTPVQVDDNVNSMSRSEALEAGINPDNWNVVRVALIISGSSSLGPVMDELEWVGTRDEYAQGSHMREAFLHAQHRGIKSPTIIPHTDSGHLLRAAEFMTEFRSQFRPSLRASERMAQVLESNLVNLDLANVHPDKAKHYLVEIQRATRNLREQKLLNLEEIGMVEAVLKRQAQDDLDSLPNASPKRSQGPTLN